MLVTGQGGCDLSGLGLSSRGLGREQWGEPAPPKPEGSVQALLPLPTRLLLCVCVYWGVRGILLFAFVSLFFFLVCPLDSPWLGSVEGGDTQGGPGELPEGEGVRLGMGQPWGVGKAGEPGEERRVGCWGEAGNFCWADAASGLYMLYVLSFG